MAHNRGDLLAVQEVATGLGVAPRTVRYWLQTGQLPGEKMGGIWHIWGRDLAVSGLKEGDTLGTPQHLRPRLRQVGARLMTVGNHMAGAQHQRSQVFLTWRRPRSLQIIFALGRQHPTHGWTPQALGTELPFWFREQAQWRRVLPLLRRYEQVRSWCHPRLLRIPGVREVVHTALAHLEATLLSFEQHEAPKEGTEP
jgi:hypothetical protein